jgi:hypothetical protein
MRTREGQKIEKVEREEEDEKILEDEEKTALSFILLSCRKLRKKYHFLHSVKPKIMSPQNRTERFLTCAHNSKMDFSSCSYAAYFAV